MARYTVMYEIEVKHSGLNKYRHIRGSDQNVVKQKARVLQSQWDEEWEKKQVKERAFQAKQDRKLAAEQMNEQARFAINEVQNILNHTLAVNDAIDWDALKDKSPYPEKAPVKRYLQAPVPQPIDDEPLKTNFAYQPKFDWLCYLFKARKMNRIEKAEALYLNDHQVWLEEKSEIEEKNARRLKQYFDELKKTEEEYRKEAELYQSAKEFFEKEQEKNNQLVDQKKSLYFSGDSGAVIDYCEMVLGNSRYPDGFPQDYEIEYNPDTRILIVDYQLPNIENLPSTKEVRYLKSKDDIQVIDFSEKEKSKLYDDVVYQVILRTIHELFEADLANVLSCVIFNGIVTYIDKANGIETTSCIASIQASKDEFMAINLALVDPKTCFKSLKGIGSTLLHSMTPIPPILQIDKTDRRFISGYSVASEMDESTNLAAISWEDFEHLIREIFEKEFSQNGGECKVTRASRDGGVDAIAFDPDPIRGGKIVIQAKRYTKTVGVSAVRDLYGTVVNEGATKGILVTTADYGPDSYEFAKGKPLTLLNGSNLLHLLASHGHKAHINLAAARAG